MSPHRYQLRISIEPSCAMPHDHPQTPQSPSQRSPGIADQPPKPTYTETNDSLLTPAHSISGSMSSTHPEYIHDGSSKTETGVGGDFSNKRKRELEDNGDREQKKVHVEDSIIGIDALHFEVGPKYLFMQTRKTPFFSSSRRSLFGTSPSSSTSQLLKHLVNELYE